MKNTFFLAVLLLSAVYCTGQKLIALQHNGNSTFYEKLDSALSHALTGDTLYLPGGGYVSPSKPISKKLHLIGAGVHPDSSKATFITLIDPQIQFDQGSDGSSITGIKTSLVLNFDCNNFKISRCDLGIEATNKKINNLLCTESILRWTKLESSYNNSFLNNIFDHTTFSYGEQLQQLGTMCICKNNIFLCPGWLIKSSNSSFENNIFTSNDFRFAFSPTQSQFQHNIFRFGSLSGNGNVESDNLFDKDPSQLFVNYSNDNRFNFNFDFHLKPGSPGKNAGSDGTDIGIYGGFYPWKDGSFPFNPHIQSFAVDPKTSQNGNLNVNVKVKAQDR